MLGHRRLLLVSILWFGISGCGPSDDTVATRVDSALAADDTVGTVRLTVDSKEKVVTLSGRIADQGMRRRAVQIARETRGVVDVIDRMVVQARPATADSSAATPMSHGPGRRGLERHR